MSIENGPHTELSGDEPSTYVANKDKAEVMAYAERYHREEAAHRKKVGRRVLDHAEDHIARGGSLDSSISTGIANDLGVRSALPEFQSLASEAYGHIVPAEAVMSDKEQQLAIGKMSLSEVSDLIAKSTQVAIDKARQSGEDAGESYDKIQEAREKLDSLN